MLIEEIAAGAKCPAGYVHLPNGTEAEWLKQLVAEQLVTVKTKRGFSRLEWQKLRERNEALDCRVYARVAAWIGGADRWTEAMWRNLEQQVGVAGEQFEDKSTPLATPNDNAAGMIRRRHEPRSRRVFRSSYMTFKAEIRDGTTYLRVGPTKAAKRGHAASVGGELGGLPPALGLHLFRKPRAHYASASQARFIESFKNLIVSQHHRRHPPRRPSSLTA